MEAHIKSRYHDGILAEAMRRYHIADGHIQLLDGFESFMYEFERGGQSYVLRIGHSLRRSVELIQGEVDWLNYLADGGVSVARAVPSADGELVERIDDGQGEQFLTTAFVKAQGEPPSYAIWDAPLFEQYGRTIGRMHARTQTYWLPNPAWKRPEWNAPDMLYADEWLSDPEDAIALDHYRQLLVHLEGLPSSDSDYGLIHQDAHGGNFFVDAQGTLTFFDFDDCAYSWFANDIAIVLFYASLWQDNRPDFTPYFMTHFLRGYREENQLEASWLREMPHFLKLREIDLYAQIRAQFDNYWEDPWCARYMTGRKEKIDQNLPYIDVDFESLADLL
ncbi:MAG: phosphotransferase [Anaerolineae bacterium]|nr:phosphotransferase [Anaerolineae bacterium]